MQAPAHRFLLSLAGRADGGRLRVLVQVLPDPAPAPEGGVLRLPLEVSSGRSRTRIEAIGLPLQGGSALITAEVVLPGGAYVLGLPGGRTLRRFRISPGLPRPLRNFCPHPGGRSWGEGLLQATPEGAPRIASGRFRFASCCTSLGGADFEGLALFLSDGTGMDIVVDGRKIRLRPGEYLAAGPWTRAGLAPRQRYPVRHIIVHFSQEVLDRFCADAGVPKGVFALSPLPRRIPEGLAEALRRLDLALAAGESALDAHAVRIAADAVFLQLAQGHPKVRSVPPGAARDPRLSRALAFLEARFCGPVGIRELAARAGASPTVLRGLFRAAFGVGPNEHLQRLRVERAKALLKDRANSVERVAQLVGYRDARSFRRVFKAHALRGIQAFRPRG